MDRKEDLLKLLNNDITYVPLITEMVYLEKQLDELRELPKIRICPSDPSKQKTTPAARLYKEYLQQYSNIIRILMRATGTDEADEESPLRKWVNERIDQSQDSMDS
jgi:hypothetical protein